MIKRIIFFITTLATLQSYSQRSTSSPYSFFGVGEEFGTRTVEQISMGSIGAAYSSSYQLNFINPASLSDLRFATYAFGLLNNDLRVKDPDTNQSSNSTSLSYFTIAVPVGNHIGMVMGMQPTSAVGYSLINSIEDTDGELIDLTQYTGDGALNRLYGGFGVRLFKGFSIGAEVDFLFGNVQNNVLNLRQNVVLATKNVEDTNIRGGTIAAGAQYRKVLKDDLHLDAGVTLKLSNNLRISGEENLYSLTISSFGIETPRDTIYSQSLNGRFNRPLETTLGVGIGRDNKWYLELDYSFRDAFRSTGYLDASSDNFAYTNANAIRLGGFYIPKANSISSYWDRVTYRAGAHLTKTGLLANGILGGNTFTEINDFGMSFGLGLPVGKNFPSTLSMTFEYGKKGTTNNGLLQENYLNLRLGLSLNDLWFRKRQID